MGFEPCDVLCLSKRRSLWKYEKPKEVIDRSMDRWIDGLQLTQNYKNATALVTICRHVTFVRNVEILDRILANKVMNYIILCFFAKLASTVINVLINQLICQP